VSVKLRIYTCPEWKAARPKAPPIMVPQAQRIIIHHTAGHHAEISNPNSESIQEAFAYARSIQRFHMVDNGWNDSGHNFLVTRAGQVLQGRWITVSAIEAGHMVVSAHCPGQNDQVGIEHEHLGAEAMTEPQRLASARLIAWISDQYGLSSALPLHPHSEFFATACPANLKGEIPALARLANQILGNAV
jgi:hypothetical protein